MKTTFAFDVGSNSIGWAVVTENPGKILGTGVKIFTEGVDNYGQGKREISKNAQRRQARQVRRQHLRRRQRKYNLIRCIQPHGMAPLSQTEIERWSQDGRFPSTRAFDEWLGKNPYQLRADALVRPLDPLEAGRLFYHMAQRRGFLSDSRSASKQEGAEEQGVLYKGKPAEGKVGIDETSLAMGGATLGEYLASLLPKDGESYKGGLQRVRNRYTSRDMYIDEFRRIWSIQKSFGALWINDGLYKSIGAVKRLGDVKDGILFHQRPLRSAKGFVGKCTFESGKRRAHKSHPLVEEFRVWQFVNSIKVSSLYEEPRFLNKEERRIVADLLFSKKRPKFADVRKRLKLTDRGYQFNYEDDQTCPGAATISALSNKVYFGKAWFGLSRKEQQDIWHALYFFDDRNCLQRYAEEKWGFTEMVASRISRMHLEDGYASLSLKAISNILPFLKLGYLYNEAVAMGGVVNVFKLHHKREASNEEVQLVTDHVPSIVSARQSGSYLDQLTEFLQSLGVPESLRTKLYHHSAQELTAGDIPKWDKWPTTLDTDRAILNIRNPVVSTALFELRRVVNALLEEFGRPDVIKVELARDIKGSKEHRLETTRKQRKQADYHDQYREEIRNLDVAPTFHNLTKYRLWKEVGKTCPYTGKSISCKQLFSAEVEIEHILPYSKSLDDSYTNITLCFKSENNRKGDRSPYEFYYGIEGPDKWEEVRQRAFSIFKQGGDEFPDRKRKYERFIQKSYDDDFVHKQLSDTRYISTQAVKWLRPLADKIIVVPGQATARFRHLWGLNSILNPNGGGKSREDHRHHAVDALTVACTSPRMLQVLANFSKYKKTDQTSTSDFPEPWPGFLDEARQSVLRILVSHRQGRKAFSSGTARGTLHKETVYGKRKLPGGGYSYHTTKPLETLTTASQVKKIVDEKVRDAVERVIEKAGGYEGTEHNQIPKGVFFGRSEDGFLIPKVYLPNKKGGDPVPVYRVRIRENLSKVEALHENSNQYVNPRNNHHVLIYRDHHGNLREDVVTFWKAVERLKQRQQIVQLPEDGKEVVAVLQENDMFLLKYSGDRRSIDLESEAIPTMLYRVQKISSMKYEFRLATEASSKSNERPFFERIQSFGGGITGWISINPIPVRIDNIGRIKFRDA